MVEIVRPWFDYGSRVPPTKTKLEVKLFGDIRLGELIEASFFGAGGSWQDHFLLEDGTAYPRDITKGIPPETEWREA